MEEETVQLNIRISKETMKKLKINAIEADVSLQDYVSNLVEGGELS